MKKVFLIHGQSGSPNGGWRPYLMRELQKKDIYACSLAMPDKDIAICEEWVQEIAHHVEKNTKDEIYLIGHSLGGPAILHYLEQTTAANIKGVILVSSPSEKITDKDVIGFLQTDINFEKILSAVPCFAVIHGDDDPIVPIQNGGFLADKLKCDLIVIHKGKHLNGSAGFYELPECMKVLEEMFV
jgi:predicted alpha/beta hydrolase family esterase